MYLYESINTPSYTTSTTNMYNKDFTYLDTFTAAQIHHAFVHRGRVRVATAFHGAGVDRSGPTVGWASKEEWSKNKRVKKENGQT